MSKRMTAASHVSPFPQDGHDATIRYIFRPDTKVMLTWRAVVACFPASSVMVESVFAPRRVLQSEQVSNSAAMLQGVVEESVRSWAEWCAIVSCPRRRRLHPTTRLPGTLREVSIRPRAILLQARRRRCFFSV